MPKRSSRAANGSRLSHLDVGQLEAVLERQFDEVAQALGED